MSASIDTTNYQRIVNDRSWFHSCYLPLAPYFTKYHLLNFVDCAYIDGNDSLCSAASNFTSVGLYLCMKHLCCTDERMKERSPSICVMDVLCLKWIHYERRTGAKHSHTCPNARDLYIFVVSFLVFFFMFFFQFDPSLYLLCVRTHGVFLATVFVHLHSVTPRY